MTATQPPMEFAGGNFQRFEPQAVREGVDLIAGDNDHLSKPANIRIAQFAPVFEFEKGVRVRSHRIAGAAHPEPPGHPKMYHQIDLPLGTLRRRARTEVQADKLAEAL